MNNVSQTLRWANYLSPLLHETYEFIANTASAAVGHSAVLRVGETAEEFRNGQVDAGFLCGLLYTRTTEWHDAPVEVLAAPILHGVRYEQYVGRPLYCSDVVVHRDSHYQSFADLAGCRWAFNERASHSGYNLVMYSLLMYGLPLPYFGEMMQSGGHLESLRMVLDGRADAAAIDTQVLAVFLNADTHAAARLRVVEALGPSSSPPVAVARGLDPALKQGLREALVTLHEDPHTAALLRRGAIERFVPVADEDYDDIRAMLARVRTATI